MSGNNSKMVSNKNKAYLIPSPEKSHINDHIGKKENIFSIFSGPPLNRKIQNSKILDMMISNQIDEKITCHLHSKNYIIKSILTQNSYIINRNLMMSINRNLTMSKMTSLSHPKQKALSQKLK